MIGSVGGVEAASGSVNISLSGAPFQNLTTATTFRLWTWGNQGGSSGSAWALDDLTINGDISVIPEPGTLGLLAIAFVGLLGMIFGSSSIRKQIHLGTHSLRSSAGLKRCVIWLAGLTLTTGMLPAAVIGYWRFEDSPGFFSDSSGNALTLGTLGTAPTQVTKPAAFPATIPQNGLTNAESANLPSDGNFTIADNALFAVGSAFTIETYVNSADYATGAVQAMTGQWGASLNVRSWHFSLSTTGVLQLALSGDGNAQVFVPSGVTLEDGDSYYLAAVYNGALATNQVTFYYQNLTDAGALLSVSADTAVTSVFDSTTVYAIGGVHDTSAGGGNNQSRFTGTMDEVRWSNTALPESALLAIPEASTWALLAFSLTTVMVLRRRRKA